MATVEHYDMHLGTNSYYVSANQQLSLMYDKTKKTWSQRLKITKTEKSPTTLLSSPQQQPQHQKSQFHHQINEFPIDYSPGALSRSMKYAEPWLYGTVRGIPARPVHHHHHNGHGVLQTIYTPIPTEVAIMVCSCPEYLTGTKRDLKKASICKKCRGSRLPLAPIGGTVRIRPTSTPIIHTGRAGTMRLPSTTKSRPTILDSQNDPYDMMRRTRLLSPEPVSVSTGPIKSIKSLDKSYVSSISNKNNSRAKSTSPSRSRSRHRSNSSLMTNISNSSNSSIKSGNSNGTKINPSDENGTDELTSDEKNILRTRSASRGKKERWLDSPDIDKGGRRSILHCDVNPYELISGSSLTNNEFSPSDNDHDNIFTTNPNNSKLRNSLISITSTDFVDNNKSIPLKIHNYNNVQAIAGQRISLGDQQTSSSLITQNGESFLYENDMLSVIETKILMPSNRTNGDNINVTNYQNSPKLGIKTTVMENDKSILYHPKKPPRRKHELCSSTDEDNEIPLSAVKISNINNNNNNVTNMANDFQLTSVALSQIPTDLVNSQKQEIKSILKRPSSVSSTISTSSASDNDAKYLNNTNSSSNSNVTAEAHTNITSITTEECSEIGTTNNNKNNKVQITTKSYNDKNNYEKIGNYKNVKKFIGSGNSEPKNNIIKTGSQFYLPFPQARKKVQFMVEDKIIHDEPELEKDNINCKKSYTEKSEIFNGVGKDEKNKIDDDNDDNGGGNDMTERITNKEHFYCNENFNQQRKQNEIIEHLQMKSKEITEKNLKNSNQIIEESLKNNNIEDKLINSNGNKNTTIELQSENENYLNNQETIIKENSEIFSMEKLRTSTNLLRRTNSERCSNLTTSVVLNFNDTMALRIKSNRTATHNIFPVTSKDISAHQQLVFRPKEPPPPPPPSLSVQNSISLNTNTNSKKISPQTKNLMTSTSNKDVTTKTNEKNSTIMANTNKGLTGKQKELKQTELEKFHNSKSQPSRPPRQINNKKITSSWNCNENSSSSNSNSSETVYGVGGLVNNTMNGLVKIKDINERDDKENSSDITIEGISPNIYENFNDQSLKIIELNDYRNENIKLSSDLVEIKMVDKNQKFQEQMAQNNVNKRHNQAQIEISNGSRLFGINNNNNHTINKYGQQKTVVRVAPFNKTSSEIHRLKINHTDDLINNSSSKKTSILINGDDCYSTVNVTNDTQIYQSSVVVTDSTKTTNINSLSNQINDNKQKNSISNTVTINVNSSPRTPEEDIIYKNNKINTLLSMNATKSIIPINSTQIESNISDKQNDIRIEESQSTTIVKSTKRGRTLITLDFEKSKDNNLQLEQNNDKNQVFSHEEELVKILRNPVEAVRRNLIPHVCGKNDDTKNIPNNHEIDTKKINLCSDISKIEKPNDDINNIIKRQSTMTKDVILPKHDRNSFIGKLLEDPTLSQLAEGLDGEVVVKLIENSLKRLKDNRNSIDTSGTKDNDDMTKLIDISLQKIKEERLKYDNNNHRLTIDEQERQSNRGSISSGNSYSSANYELFDFDNSNNESDCYQSCSSELTTGDEDTNSTRSKFYQMLVDATLSEIEITTNIDDDHHYESIRINNGNDPIYEEISEVPPPLPLTAPPLNDIELEKKSSRSMFEGASKYDILSYLVDARERGIVREEGFEYNFNNTTGIIVEEEIDTLSDLKKKQQTDMSSRISHLSITSDSSEDTSLTSSINDKLLVPSSGLTNGIQNEQSQKHNNRQQQQRKLTSIDIERNDSGVGSETSKSSRSKYQNPPGCLLNKNSPIHLCEDCDGPVETQITDSGVMYAPLVCRKCGKKRAERKEIITEIVETEEKYGRDLQIILEEFCQPMFVAGLLTQEQLSAIFLNTEELLENNQTLAERMRDGLDIALEQGDDDLLTVNIGKIFLESTPMLHAFESYCVRQAASSLLLANLEKEKELLRIFLRVSQMENTVLRRMNLNSFLMVPVQRVTKYPLLLARLFKVTPSHLDGRDLLKQAQEKIELHLNHMNQEAKDVPTKLWRRISSSSPNRRASCEIDMINIKLRKMAIDILEWNHDEVRFAMEGKLLFTQPTDGNWKKGRTIKLTTVNSLLVTNGKPSTNYKIEKAISSDQLNFPKHTGIREASLLLFKEKCGRYTLIREPLYLDKCIICTEADWDDYFEVHEISSKDTFIFKAEDGVRTKHWYKQLQYHAQGMGAWRKRRNALANIMINGMLSRT